MNTRIKSRARAAMMAATMALLVLGASPPGAAAQTNFMGALHLNGGVPGDEWRDKIDRDAYGLGGQFFFAPSTSAFGVGVEVSWMNYGSVSRTEAFSPDIPDVRVDVETMNNVAQGLFVLRGQVPGGPIQPYVDAVVGLNYLYTETSVKDTDGSPSSIASTTNHDDAVLAYGFGGGVMIPVHRRAAGPDGSGAITMSLDAGARYIHGDRARYLGEGSVRITDGRVELDTLESRTDLLRVHAGMSIRF